MARQVAVFDFDNTITRKDTFLEFVKFACGINRFWIGFLIYSPLLIAMKIGLYPNGRAKERVFSHFFKNWKYDDFRTMGEQFNDNIKLIVRDNILNLFRAHISQGDKVYIVTASIEDWVCPWGKDNGAIVIGTKIEVDEKGILTGRFLTPNCYGIEKVRRFLEYEPNRKSYDLLVYSDGKGDMDLMKEADKAIKVNYGVGNLLTVFSQFLYSGDNTFSKEYL